MCCFSNIAISLDAAYKKMQCNPSFHKCQTIEILRLYKHWSTLNTNHAQRYCLNEKIVHARFEKTVKLEFTLSVH